MIKKVAAALILFTLVINGAAIAAGQDKEQEAINAAQYMTSIPGGPDGEYVVIQFDTSFGNKKAAVETVTPMMEKDGKWRVSGYYIR